MSSRDFLPKTLLMIIILSGLTIGLILTTPIGVRFIANLADDYLDNLETSNISGSFSDSVHLDQLKFSVLDWSYIFTDLRISISIKCALTGRVCIESIEADRIHISLPYTEPKEYGEVSGLPSLNLPFYLSITSATIKQFDISKAEKTLVGLTNTQSDKLTWWGSSLHLNNIAAESSGQHVKLEGKMQTKGKYKLNLNAAINPQALSLTGLPIRSMRLSLTGNIETLIWDIQSLDALPFTGHGSILATTAGLPIEGSVQVSPQKTISAQGVKFTADSNQITFKGFLDNETFEFKSKHENILIERDQEHWNLVSVSSQGELKNRTLHFSKLEALIPDHSNAKLSTSEQPQVSVNGSVVFGETLQWDATTTFYNFNTNFVYSKTDDLHFTGTLESRGQSDFTQFKISTAAANLNIKHSGATFTLDGKSSGRFDIKLKNVEIDQTTLSIYDNDNRLNVSGSYPNGVISSWIDAKRVENIVPLARILLPKLEHYQVSGSLGGKTFWSTSDHEQEFKVDLSLKNLGLNAFKSESIDIVGRLSGRNLEQLSFNLTSRNQRYDETPMGTINLVANGQREAPATNLLWENPSFGNLEVGCKTEPTPSGKYIAVQCQKLQLTNQRRKNNWGNAESIELKLTAINKVTINPFCIKEQSESAHSETEICLSAPVNFDQSRLLSDFTLTATKMPWAIMHPLFPTTLDPQGFWQANITAKGNTRWAAIQAKAQFASLDTVWHWQINKQSGIDFNSPNTEVTLLLSGKSFDASGRIQTDQFGELIFSLTPLQQQHRFEIELLKADLALINTLYPLADNLQGSITAKLHGNTSPTDPDIQGKLRIENASLGMQWLPMPIRALYIDGGFKNDDFNFNGHYQIAETLGDLSGHLELNGRGLNGSAQLAVNNLRYAINPNAWLLSDALLNIDIANRQISVGGDLDIFKARINLKSLPEEAIDISADTVILGSDEQSTEWPFSTNLVVKLRDDVQLRALGLETTINGNMNLWQNSGEALKGRGIVTLENGHYRAYGQDLAIQSGKLIFSGNLSNPDIAITAKRNNTPTDITVGLRLSGELNAPDLEIFSTPEMSEENKMYYLLTGQAAGESALDENTQAQQAALSLGLNLSSQRAEKLASEFGIDDFRIGTAQSEKGQSIQMSGNITPNLHVRYGYELFDEINSLSARYQVKKNLFVELFRGAANAVDILWSFEVDRKNKYKEE